MLQSDDVGGVPQLDFEAWRALLRSEYNGAGEVAQPISRAADKLFARIRGVIEDGFSDPDFGPAEVVAEARISLRYVQGLLTERGATCGESIYSHRRDHAAHLLHHRALPGTGQSLNEIAYAGRDNRNDAVRAGTGKSASSARDVSFRTS
jgi:hypothetical protein